MAYILSPRLFVENGPAILAGRRRATRFSALEYELSKKPTGPAKTGEQPVCRAA